MLLANLRKTNMITVSGKNGIRATVLAHSCTQLGKTLITWEIEYPRLILAELNTHRELSRNSFSSRAVPFLKMLEQLEGEPVRFGANQAGMQDRGEDFNAPVYLDIDRPYDDYGVLFSKEKTAFSPKTAWIVAKNMAIAIAKAFHDAGYHKQVYNRLLESWQMQKTVISATQVDNFFWLRDDDAADPTIRELARVMRAAMDASEPISLMPGEWHLPYIVKARSFTASNNAEVYALNGEDFLNGKFISLEDAIKVSCARCAAVSYRNEGYDLAKSLEVYDRLVGSEKKHASAFEHCATPIKQREGSYLNALDPRTWEPGVSHMDRDTNLWSGNFQGWIQYRKLIPGECYRSGK